MFLFLLIAYTHFGAWGLQYCFKILVRKQKIYHIVVFMIFFNALGTMFSCLFQGGKKFNVMIGIYLSLALNIAGQLFLKFFWGFFDPSILHIIIMVIAGLALSIYLNFDIKFMVERRGEMYAPGDWFIGAVHLQTDILFRFWVDLVKQEEEGEDISDFIEEQKEKERELNKQENVEIAIK